MLVSLVGLLFCAGVLLWTAVLCSCLLLDCCFVQLSLVGLLFFPGASCWTADCIFYIYIYTHTHTQVGASLMTWGLMMSSDIRLTLGTWCLV